MNKAPELYILHILECIQRIERYIQESGYGFTEKNSIYDSLLRRLQTMADAANHLPDTHKKQFPDIEWRKIRGFRNVLVHDYLGDYDPAILKDVVVTHLPKLKRAMLQLMPDWEEVKKRKRRQED